LVCLQASDQFGLVEILQGLLAPPPFFFWHHRDLSNGDKPPCFEEGVFRRLKESVSWVRREEKNELPSISLDRAMSNSVCTTKSCNSLLVSRSSLTRCGSIEVSNMVDSREKVREGSLCTLCVKLTTICLNSDIHASGSLSAGCEI
jgi:hypothetical protein